MNISGGICQDEYVFYVFLMSLRRFSGTFFKTSLSVFVLIENLRITMFRYTLYVYLMYNISRVASTVSLCIGCFGHFSSGVYCSCVLERNLPVDYSSFVDALVLCVGICSCRR